jgi:hypothetical protein
MKNSKNRNKNESMDVDKNMDESPENTKANSQVEAQEFVFRSGSLFSSPGLGLLWMKKDVTSWRERE